jgi:hypothetical protein
MSKIGSVLGSDSDTQCCGFGFIDSGYRTDPDPAFQVKPDPDDQKLKLKMKTEFLFSLFDKKLQKRPPLRTSKLKEKPSALKRAHPAPQKMKLINCFLFF